MVTIPYISSGVVSILTWCHMAVCSLYTSSVPLCDKRGPDEHYYEPTLCQPPALSGDILSALIILIM